MVELEFGWDVLAGFNKIDKIDPNFKKVLEYGYKEAGIKMPSDAEVRNIKKYFDDVISPMESDDRNVSRSGRNPARGYYQIQDATLKTNKNRAEKYLSGNVPKSIKSATRADKLSKDNQRLIALINVIGSPVRKFDGIPIDDMGSTMRLKAIGISGNIRGDNARDTYKMYHHTNVDIPTLVRMDNYFTPPEEDDQ